MAWDFWKSKKATDGSTLVSVEKLQKPKDIPEVVGRYLVVSLGKDPDWVWRLKSVERLRGEKNNFDVRVFDASQVAATGVRVKDYTSFDEHPELVLFNGWYDKKTMAMHMEEGSMQ